MNTPPATIRCPRCDTDKAPTDFYPSPTRRPYGLASLCKSCALERRKSYGEKMSTEAKQEMWRRSALKKKYGITAEQYDAMHDEQKGLCRICGEPERDIHHRTGKLQRLAVDHDPTTGTVRGLLCALCNKGIGSLRHSETFLLAAIAYLKETAPCPARQ